MSVSRLEQSSVMDPQGELLAGVYAQGLLDCLPTNDQAEQAAEQLEGIVGLLDRVEGFGELLTAATLSIEDRLGSIRRIFHGRILETVEGLLALLNRNGRLFLLGQVSAAFRRALNEREGKVEVFVTSAAPLGAEQRAGVCAIVAEALGAEPVLHARLDPSLGGGLRVQIGDRLYDATVAGRLAGLRRSLSRGLRAHSPQGQAGDQSDVGGASDGRRDGAA